MQARLGVGVPGEEPPGPRERDRGRLVTGEEQRERLVPHLLVGHAGPVLACAQEQREEVVARRACGAALGDHLGDHAVQVGFDAVVAAHRGRGQPHEQAEQRRVHAVEHPQRVGQGPPDRRAPLRVDVGPEQRLAHHGERERRHLGLHVELVAVAPTLGGPLGGPDHRRRVRGDPLVVEHRLDQPPLTQVGLVLAREERLAEQHLRGPDRRALMERAMVGDEHVLDEVGMVQQERGRTRDVDADHVAVRGQPLEERDRIVPERPERRELGQVRTRRPRPRLHGGIIGDRAPDRNP